MKHRSLLSLFLAFTFFLSSSVSYAAGEIHIGMSSALSGPASALGKGVKNGVDAYFKYVNDNGGINGQMLKLDAMDDGYEPARADQICIRSLMKKMYWR